MIKHIVIFKTKENAPLKIFKQKIEDLKNKIPEIKNIAVGLDINFDPDSSDFCVITEVENLKDLETYAKHPDHLDVIAFIKPYVIERKVVDFKV